MADYREDLDGFAAIQHASARYARAVAKEVGQDVQRLCPVDTGRLKSTITVEAVDDTVYVEVGTDYWEFVENGTAKMRARPVPAARAVPPTQRPIHDRRPDAVKERSV
jgi:hypothetical protein